MPDYPTVNTGYIPETRPDEFIAGIPPYVVVVSSGDWRPFVPLGEPQFSTVTDCKGCVSFSNNNTAEISLKQQGLDYNFSDRALAKLSGTTILGNSFAAVADSTYRNGRLLETDWPVPPNFTWDSFYADIPLDIRQRAIFFDESYTFISTNIDNLKYHLKQSPIQIAIPLPHPNHAVVLVAIVGTTAYYFDSYPGTTNYLKTMPVSDIEAAMKLLIKPKTMPKYYVLDDGGKLGILVVEGYAIGGGFAADQPDLDKLKDAFNVPPDVKTVVLPQ